jgi:hypothetical protein
MARNRRKDGRRDGEEGTKDVKGRPTDTNIEVLPARSHGVEKTKSVQVQVRSLFRGTALTRLGDNRSQEAYRKEKKTLGQIYCMISYYSLG